MQLGRPYSSLLQPDNQKLQLGRNLQTGIFNIRIFALGVFGLGFGNNSNEAPACHLSNGLGADRVRINNACTTMKLGSSGRRLAARTAAKLNSKARTRSLFVSDMYRSTDQSKSDKVTTEVWDGEYAAYWWDQEASLNANQMAQSTWDQYYAPFCDQSGPSAGCPLFFEIDTDGDGYIDDIRNFTNASLLPLIADKIYNGYVWEDQTMAGPNPTGYDCQQWIDACDLDACKKTDGTPMAYDSSIETHRMICSVKCCGDGNRYMDPTTVQVIDAGDGNLILAVDDPANAACEPGTVTPLRQDIYSGLYIQVISHLYNKFVVGNGSPNAELTVELNYRPRKLSQTGGIHEIPCVTVDSLKASVVTDASAGA